MNPPVLQPVFKDKSMIFDEETLKRKFPIGAVVKTPLQRMAIVRQHVNRKDDVGCRVNLQYIDEDKTEVCLQPELLKRIDVNPERFH